MMSEAGVLARLLPVLRALPLWIFIALALAGYAALFAPPFGGIDAQSFRQQWGVWCWLVAVIFTVFSLVRAIDLFVAGCRHRAARKRQRQLRRRLRRYRDLYLPLYEQLSGIYITTVSGYSAPKFRDRLRNAWNAAHYRGRGPIKASKAAWQNLFDKKFHTSGEVDYGGDFPLDALAAIAHRNLRISDPELLGLIAAARRDRIEEPIPSDALTEKDIKLYNWITTEHHRLKTLFFPD
jgi:hypothetical protein